MVVILWDWMLPPSMLKVGMKIPSKFLFSNSGVYAKEGDLPEGWYFYDDPIKDGGYIVKCGKDMKMNKELPLITLFGSNVSTGEYWEVKKKELSGAKWGHRDDFAYHLVWSASLADRPLNWNLFPDVLIGEF